MSSQAEASVANADKLLEAIASSGPSREILYKTICYCETPRAAIDIENFIEKTPEYTFGQILQTPHTLMRVLVDSGGLSKVEEREAARDEGQQGNGEQWGDDTTWQTTQIALRAAAAIAPNRRIESLLASQPKQAPAFSVVLRFCESPRSLADIERILRTVSSVTTDCFDVGYYVDQLERAGGLVWKKKWVTTEEGRMFGSLRIDA